MTTVSHDETLARLLSDVATADQSTRQITADALAEAGRDLEAKVCRSKDPVVLAATGKVVLAAVAEAAAKRKRVPRPGFPAGGTQHETRLDLGDIIRGKNGPMVVTESSPLRYVSDDHIEDMDAWASYPKGPGRYSHWTAIPVEETDGERKEREAKEAKVAAEKTEAEAAQKADADLWAPFAAMPSVYSLPASLHVEWREVYNDRKQSKFGHGMTRWIGTLPDGTQVGRVSTSQYDDWRDWYHVPESISSVIEAAKAADALRGERTKQADAAATFADESMGEDECTEAGWVLAGKDAQVVALRESFLATGDEAALADYRDALVSASRKATAERQAVLDAAAAEWLPKLTAELDEAAAKEIASEVGSDMERYAHIADPVGRFADALESVKKARAEEARKVAEKKARAAERKADPMVTVTGNTYSHRSALGDIPGSKLSKLKGGWTWKVPKSQVGKLPRGLGWE